MSVEEVLAKKRIGDVNVRKLLEPNRQNFGGEKITKMNTNRTKNSDTEKLRSLISKMPFARETDEVEGSLCAISAQSETHPEQHIVIIQAYG